MLRFENKTVLITGGGSGIGRATALRFAQEGANVVVVDINKQSAEEVAHEISKFGRSSLAIFADVGEPEECEEMFRLAQERFKNLSVVFSNAGIIGNDLVENMSIEEWDDVIRTNLRGVFLTCKYSIPSLIKAKQGAIVNMASSMAGWDTSIKGAAYMASKAGVVGLTKSLALQLARYGVRVNAVCPGIIKTNLIFKSGIDRNSLEMYYKRFERRIPLRRVGQPEDVASAVVFLASEDARHITGSMLLIDGGQTLQSWSNAPESDEYPLDV